MSSTSEEQAHGGQPEVEGEVYLGIGSNLGDRRAHLKHALGLLASLASVTAVSSVYETEPWGVVDQPRFLNLVVRVSTPLSPAELLREVKSIEQEVGREPTYPWGPRVIDIDILLFGRCLVEEVDLQIPHQRLLQRAFVVVPLLEVNDMVMLPDGRRVRESVGEEILRERGIKATAAF